MEFLKIFKLLKPFYLNKTNGNFTRFFIVIFITLFHILLNTIFTSWYGKFNDALSQKKTYSELIFLLSQFFIIASIYIVTHSEKTFVFNNLVMNTRIDMYNKFGLTVLQNKSQSVPCQRLSIDLGAIAKMYFSFLNSVLNVLVSLPIYSFMLFKIANANVAIVCILYAFFGTLISKKISHGLIEIDYDQESLEGHLRKELVKESEKDESFTLPNMDSVYGNFKLLNAKERKISYFTNMYNQFAVILPYILLLSMYLSNKISFGTFMQTASLFRYVVNDMSFLVNNREFLISIKATYKRVAEVIHH